MNQRKKRLLIFVVAYNAQHTINWVLGRVPTSLTKEFDAEILVIDDQSEDNTLRRAKYSLRVVRVNLKLLYYLIQKIRVMVAIRNLVITTQLKITLILLP